MKYKYEFRISQTSKNNLTFKVKKYRDLHPQQLPRSSPLVHDGPDVRASESQNGLAPASLLEAQESGGSLEHPVHLEMYLNRVIFLSRSISVLCVLSLLISIALVYQNLDQVDGLLDCISISTALILVLGVIESMLGYWYWNNLSHCLQTIFLYGVLVLPHPSRFFSHDFNVYMHLVLLLRILIVLRYLVRSSRYWSSRSSRITKMYGVDQDEDGLLFAFKSILRGGGLLGLGGVYLSILTFYTHSLYIASHQSQNTEGPQSFMECLEIIGTTFTTVGYGEYVMRTLLQRIIVMCTLFTGLCTNSFITLLAIRLLALTNNEQNSHSLLMSLEERDKIEALSMDFIAHCLVVDKPSHQVRQELYRGFYRKIRTYKNNIKSLSRTGMVQNLAADFKEQLRKLNTQQLRTQRLLHRVIKQLQASYTPKSIHARKVRKKTIKQCRFDSDQEIPWTNK